jgi:hypothetical protein
MIIVDRIIPVDVLTSLISRINITRYDNRAKDLTKEGMRRGIQQAAAFLVSASGSKYSSYPR